MGKCMLVDPFVYVYIIEMMHYSKASKALERRLCIFCGVHIDWSYFYTERLEVLMHIQKDF